MKKQEFRYEFERRNTPPKVSEKLKVYEGEILPPRRPIPDEAARIQVLLLEIHNYNNHTTQTHPEKVVYVAPPKSPSEDPVEHVWEQVGEGIAMVGEAIWDGPAALYQFYRGSTSHP